MEEPWTSEMLVFYHSTPYFHNPEVHNLNAHMFSESQSLTAFPYSIAYEWHVIKPMNEERP
jgi:hypothetical protein